MSTKPTEDKTHCTGSIFSSFLESVYLEYTELIPTERVKCMGLEPLAAGVS